MRAAAGVLLGLALVGFSLDQSRSHPTPVFDEVSYLQQARTMDLRSYWTLENREDNRHPLYAALLAPLTTGAPADFARAKLLTLATALLLLGVVYRSAAGLAGVAVLAFSAAFAAQSRLVLADVLFAALYLGALSLLARGRWAAFGAVAGLGYLCKGSAHFLLLGAAAAALVERKKREPLLALAAFAAVAFVLLRRNALVWGDPFHNVNAGLIWRDSWAEGLRLGGAGARWYFETHGLAEAASRFLWGAASVGGQLAQTLGTGPSWATRPTGVLVFLAAAAGLAARWKEGGRGEVLSVCVPGAALLCALAWGAKAGVSGPRLVLPVAVSLLPYAFSRVKAQPRWLAAAACAALFFGRWTANPLGFWAVTPEWAKASAYAEANVGPAGYLLPYESVFSDWDRGRDGRRPYPFDVPAEELRAVMKRRGIEHLLVDTGLGEAPDLGWKKCLDAGRYVFYCPRS